MLLPSFFIFALIFLSYLSSPLYSWGAETFDTEEAINIRVYETVHRSVVNITTVVVDYDLFFTPYASEANGSGVILNKKGYVLTNRHVITDAAQLIVTLNDSSKWEGQVIGTDEATDLAIIRIKAPAGKLHPILLGNSSGIKVGQRVLTIGNPFGLEQTLTTGIVSSIRRHLKINNIEMDNVIQTDAAINPGNSGGPLLNSKGEMIGITTAIFSPSGGNVGVGFAVPVNTIKWVTQDLLTKGYVTYAYLGIEMQTLIPEYARPLKLPVNRGVLVGRMMQNGPADRAGLQGGSVRVIVGNTRLIIGGDIIIAADHQTINSRDEMVRFLRGKKPGEQIRLTLFRDNKKRSVPITLGEKPRH